MNTIKNHITLVGEMGNKAKITNFDNGSKVARFAMSTHNFSNDSKSNKDWHRVFAWGNVAHFIENYGDDGRQLAIHGRLVNRTYLNVDGDPRKITEIEVKHVIGL